MNHTQQDITSLEDVHESIKHYKYKSIDFFYNKQDATNRLLITFHGARSSEALPIFRGYNWNYNLLALSDKLLEIHDGLKLGWYLTSEFQSIYKEIISFFLRTYSNCIFTGSSGGGLPAMLYASIFKKKAVIQNSQLYIQSYRHYKQLQTFLKDNFGEWNLEMSTLHYGPPEHAYIYVNELDTEHYTLHFLRFQEFVKKQGLESQYTFHSFIGVDPVPPKVHHHVNLPTGLTLTQLFELCFSPRV